MYSTDEAGSPIKGAATGFPSVDLGAFLTGTPEARKTIAARVDEICRNIGFLLIENHGVPHDVVSEAWSATTGFFDLPLETKLRSQAASPTCPRGYFPMAAEALARSLGVDTPPDFKESFGIGPLNAPHCSVADDDFEFHYGANIWPAEPESLREPLTSYFNSMESLGAQLMTLFAAALGLPSDYFVPFHTHPMCALRCISYPPSVAPLLPGQTGAGEHSDYGSITILKSDPEVPGLEIKLPSGSWARAPLVKDAFIVNIGDMMARWTNDRWVSTMHRVVLPGMTASVAGRRQSLAFFYNTGCDARIECIPTCLPAAVGSKYDPVRAGDYLIERFTSALN